MYFQWLNTLFSSSKRKKMWRIAHMTPHKTKNTYQQNSGAATQRQSEILRKTTNEQKMDKYTVHCTLFASRSPQSQWSNCTRLFLIVINFVVIFIWFVFCFGELLFLLLSLSTYFECECFSLLPPSRRGSLRLPVLRECVLCVSSHFS